MVAFTAKHFTEQESERLLIYIQTSGAPAPCPCCGRPAVERVESVSRPLFNGQQAKFPVMRWAVLQCTFCRAGGRHPE